jgi:putative peptide zinc metalloprotease protein
MNDNNQVISQVELVGIQDEYFAYINDKCFRINKLIFEFVQCLKQGKSKTQIQSTLLKDYNQESIELINSKVDEFIVKIENTAIQKNTTYIKPKINLTNERQTARIASQFKALIQPNVFGVLLSISILANLFYFFFLKTEPVIKGMSVTKIIAIYVISGIMLFFHEIGHASATLFYKRHPKEIGFGFYFVLPVFFTNVTQIWTLPRNQRIVINLGGVYFQLLLNSLLILVLALFHQVTEITTPISYVINTNIIVILYSLIPFMRNDGYWLYSDLFNIENLIRRSDYLPKKILSKLFSAQSKTTEIKNEIAGNVPLFIYSLSNWAFKIYVCYLLIHGFVGVVNAAVDPTLWTTPYPIKDIALLALRALGILLGTYMFGRYLLRILNSKITANDGF